MKSPQHPHLQCRGNLVLLNPLSEKNLQSNKRCTDGKISLNSRNRHNLQETDRYLAGAKRLKFLRQIDTFVVAVVFAQVNIRCCVNTEEAAGLQCSELNYRKHIGIYTLLKTTGLSLALLYEV